MKVLLRESLHRLRETLLANDLGRAQTAEKQIHRKTEWDARVSLLLRDMGTSDIRLPNPTSIWEEHEFKWLRKNSLVRLF